MQIATAVGALLTVLMWTAVLPPTGNPFMDDRLRGAVSSLDVTTAKSSAGPCS